tara:strand:+ start:14 stop:565 length:552 start_codon:yes stop_codon:yes gene_type:complete
MGLDMYLEGSFSTPSYIRPTDADYEARQEGKEIVVKRSPELEDALNAIGFQNAPIAHAYNHMTYVFPIITWRKANAIHKFFVDTCQEGNDNCQRHYVSRENLEELLETINTILAVKTPVARELKAEELLPTDNEGCFFGSEEYDDWYFQDLKRTKATLDKLFKYEENAEAGKNFDNFYYQSSW